MDLKINFSYPFSLFNFSFRFTEAMRLISDIKNDHFEPINFLQVSWRAGRITMRAQKPFIYSTASNLFVELFVYF